jgi:phosphoglycolate phosphatase
VILYLFDIDGTLLLAHGAGRTAYDDVFQATFGIADASNGVRYGGKTDREIANEIWNARLGRPPTSAELDAFLDAYIPQLRVRVAERGVRVLDGVIAVLDALEARADRVVCGIATGNIRAGAAIKLATAGLDHRFAFGGYGCDHHVRAEVVARAIERGRERGGTGEVVVVGDTTHDIAAARACGATVCAVATGANTAAELAAADAVFASLAELPAWHAARFD